MYFYIKIIPLNYIKREKKINKNLHKIFRSLMKNTRNIANKKSTEKYIKIHFIMISILDDRTE